MIKRILLTLLQFFAFCGLFYVGGNWDAIRFGQEVRAMTTHTTFWNPIPTIKYPISSTHTLIANGLVFALVLLLLLLGLQAWRRALRPWALLTLLAFIVAAVLCFSKMIGLPPAG